MSCWIRSSIQRPLFYCLCGAVALNIALMLLVKKHGIFARLQIVEDLSNVGTEFVPEVADRFGKKFTGEDIHQVRIQLMQEVRKAEINFFDASLDLLEVIESGGGLVCGGMAVAYFHSLAGQGYKARIVSFFRHSGITPDSHISVEVFENGRWVLYDPTFNTAYLKGPMRLGAMELQKELLREGASQVKPEFLGEVNYPARLENYYIDWRPLVNNIFVVGRSVSISRDRFGLFLAKVPPFRYWFGPVYFYEKDLQADHHALNKILYFVSMVVLPMLAFGFFSAWGIQARRNFRARTKV